MFTTLKSKLRLQLFHQWLIHFKEIIRFLHLKLVMCPIKASHR